jgi:hypothetical protein
MIDFNKIKPTIEQLGTFGDKQVKAEIHMQSIAKISPEYSNSKMLIEKSEELVKRELFEKVYGDLIPPFHYLKHIIEHYVIPTLDYQRHPWFVDEKEIKETLEKLQKLLEPPK